MVLRVFALSCDDSCLINDSACMEVIRVSCSFTVVVYDVSRYFLCGFARLDVSRWHSCSCLRLNLDIVFS